MARSVSVILKMHLVKGLQEWHVRYHVRDEHIKLCELAFEIPKREKTHQPADNRQQHPTDDVQPEGMGWIGQHHARNAMVKYGNGQSNSHCPRCPICPR